MDARAFLKLGNSFTKTNYQCSVYIAERRFSSFFGVTPRICEIIWNKIKQSVPIGGQPKHLLWCLSFLKQYAVEHYRRSIFNADEKTIRNWTWTFVKILSDLDVVYSFTHFANLYTNYPNFTCRFLGKIDSMGLLMDRLVSRR